MKEPALTVRNLQGFLAVVSATGFLILCAFLAQNEGAPPVSTLTPAAQHVYGACEAKLSAQSLAANETLARLHSELTAQAASIAALRATLHSMKSAPAAQQLPLPSPSLQRPVLSPSISEVQPLPCKPEGQATHALRPFDAREWPAFVIARPSHLPYAAMWRKWTESELSRLGYTEYTNIPGFDVDTAKSLCVDEYNVSKKGCREGLTLSHAEAWQRAATWDSNGTVRGFLIVEEDVTFHSDFLHLWPQYEAELRNDFSVVWVGHVSQTDSIEKPLTEDLSNSTAPWGVHAYVVTKDSAAFLSRLIEFEISRANWPQSHEPHIFTERVGKLPWQLTVADIIVDFFTMSAHHFFYRPHKWLPKSPRPKPWWIFHSSRLVPARLGAMSWVQTNDILTGTYSGKVAECSAPIDCDHPESYPVACGPRLPLQGAGLAFQNQCKQNPFMLLVWAKERSALHVPSCAELRLKIRPLGDDDCSNAKV
jgi:hypothetical protein